MGDRNVCAIEMETALSAMTLFFLKKRSGAMVTANGVAGTCPRSNHWLELPAARKIWLRGRRCSGLAFSAHEIDELK